MERTRRAVAAAIQHGDVAVASASLRFPVDPADVSTLRPAHNAAAPTRCSRSTPVPSRPEDRETHQIRRLSVAHLVGAPRTQRPLPLR